jgi:hypothetical protein
LKFAKFIVDLIESEVVFDLINFFIDFEARHWMFVYILIIRKVWITNLIDIDHLLAINTQDIDVIILFLFPGRLFRLFRPYFEVNLLGVCFVTEPCSGLDIGLEKGLGFLNSDMDQLQTWFV